MRGIERRKVFIDDVDRDVFINRMGAILSQTGTECFAWALIPTHFHFLLRTGNVPIATVIRRLTGHAVTFNRRHRRIGHLFQNRYQSILCQEDAYLLELVRYIHLNPLRAGRISDMTALDIFAYSGHDVVVGICDQKWQSAESVLRRFGKQPETARQRRREFAAKGIRQGKRKDLTGGGLIRSAGGWASVKALRAMDIHEKSHEQILGDGALAEKILPENREALERRYALKAKGVTVDKVAVRLAQVLEMPLDRVWEPGRLQSLVSARSLLCFWAVHELVESMAAMGRRLGISTVAVSKSVRQGAGIAERLDAKLIR